jgi:SAM-dependent methyltransferase
MHGSVMQYLSTVQKQYQHKFSKASVLEMGSFDANGSARSLFSKDVSYTGIDARPGPGVDEVCVAHEYTGPKVDVVVTTEMLEHDPYWEKTISNALRLLKPGGLFIFTCAAPKRAAHELQMSPTPGYYGNRSIPEMDKAIIESAKEQNISITRTELLLGRGDLDLYGFVEIV